MVTVTIPQEPTQQQTASPEPTVEESKRIEMELLAIFAKMECIDERIEKDQQEIDRLKVKTRAALAQLSAR